MGKACLILAATLLVLALYPKNEVNGASLEVPDSDTEDNKAKSPDMDGDLLNPHRSRDEYYDYDFLNSPPYGGGYPRGRGLRAMQRHERMMKRLRRHSDLDGRPPFAEPRFD